MEFLNSQFFIIEISKYLTYDDLRKLKLAFPNLLLSQNLYLDKKQQYQRLSSASIDETDRFNIHLPELVWSLYIQHSGIINDVLTITQNNKTIIYVIYDQNYFGQFFIGYFRNICFSDHQQQIEFISVKHKKSYLSIYLFSFALLVGLAVYNGKLVFNV